MTLREQTVAIAVIGVPGSGKSTFINLASGSSLPTGKSLGSCTTALESSTFSLDGRTVTLIDTPGFDETTASVLDVLKSISDYFSRLYSQGVKLAGVIYMHCVAENHMSSPSRRHFHTFSKFCGDTTLRDVIIVNSDCPGEAHNNGNGRRGREPARREECFASAIDKGARMLRHDGSQASAHAILRHLIHRQPAILSVQAGSSRTDSVHTVADTCSVRELTEQVERQTKAFGELCKGIDMAALTEDKETKEALQEEAKTSLEKIERIRYDLERLVTSIASKNSQLESENRRYKSAFSAQKTEVELRTRLLEEERRAREIAEATRGRVESLLAEERALWERGRVEKENVTVNGQKYGKLFACGAVIFALVCASQFVLGGSTSLPL